MYLRDKLSTPSPKLSTILLVAAIFGILAFLFSILGFLNNQPTNYRVNIYGSVSPQEVGGHFLFGYIVAFPTRNLRMGLLAGLMALAIDTDHIFNAAGFQTSIRPSHSIVFAILASILIGIIASQIFGRRYLGDVTTTTKPRLAASLWNVGRKAVTDHKELYDSRSSLNTKIFFQLLIITLAAYISHIAYDVFVDTQANFPLLAPFSFHEVLIPQIYALPIEGAAVLLVYLGYAAVTSKRCYQKDGP